MALQIMWHLAGSQEQFSRITKVDSAITIEELFPTIVDDVTRPPQQQPMMKGNKTNDDEEKFPLISLQQAVKEHLMETGGEQKVYLLFCSPNLKYLYFFSMHFPDLPCVAIAYDKVNSSELPPWSAPALVLKSSKCANHPYWKEAVRRRAASASPKVEVTATAPNAHHYAGLKRIAKYLCCTRDWGIMYWRPSPLTDLPAVEPPVIPSGIDISDGPFPKYDLMSLTCFVDAAHANDPHTRRSVTGFVHCLSGGAIAYKSKLQTCVATSSTEAEFYAAVHAAKTLKYLCSFLHELGFTQSDPTPKYIDNESALKIINHKRPLSVGLSHIPSRLVRESKLLPPEVVFALCQL